MKIQHISRVKGAGTQVVLNLFCPYRIQLQSNLKDRIVEGGSEFSRWQAVARQIQKTNDVVGRFIRADVRYFIGGLEQVQLSYREERR